jgi:hypothetical protein
MDTQEKIKLASEFVLYKWFFRLGNRVVKRGIFDRLIVLLDDSFFTRNEQYETTALIHVVVESVTVSGRKSKL